MSYFDNNCLPQAYWTATSGSGVLYQVLKNASSATVTGLTALLNGDTLETAVRTNLTYKQITGNSQTHIYSLLLMSGYLKPEIIKTLRQDHFDKAGVVGLKIPNKEIAEVYRKHLSVVKAV